MEVTKQSLQAAIAAVKSLVSENAKVVLEAAGPKEALKDYSTALRRTIMAAVAQAHLLSAGPETVRKLFGDSFIKAAGDSFKVRLSEANKIRRLHEQMDTLAEMWAGGQEANFKEETGYTVSQALKDVAKPSDPMAGIGKAVVLALTNGVTAKDVTAHVALAIKQWQVEQDFLAQQQGAEADTEASEIAEAA